MFSEKKKLSKVFHFSFEIKKITVMYELYVTKREKVSINSVMKPYFEFEMSITELSELKHGIPQVNDLYRNLNQVVSFFI